MSAERTERKCLMCGSGEDEPHQIGCPVQLHQEHAERDPMGTLPLVMREAFERMATEQGRGKTLEAVAAMVHGVGLLLIGLGVMAVALRLWLIL